MLMTPVKKLKKAPRKMFRVVVKVVQSLKEPEPEKVDVKPLPPVKMEWSDLIVMGISLSIPIGFMIYKYYKGTLEL